MAHLGAVRRARLLLLPLAHGGHRGAQL